MNKGTIVKLQRGETTIYRTLEVVEYYLERGYSIIEEETIEEKEIVLPLYNVKATVRKEDENTCIITTGGKEYKVKCNEFKNKMDGYVSKVYKREKCVKSCYYVEKFINYVTDEFWECVVRGLVLRMVETI